MDYLKRMNGSSRNSGGLDQNVTSRFAGFASYVVDLVVEGLVRSIEDRSLAQAGQVDADGAGLVNLGAVKDAAA